MDTSEAQTLEQQDHSRATCTLVQLALSYLSDVVRAERVEATLLTFGVPRAHATGAATLWRQHKKRSAGDSLCSADRLVPDPAGHALRGFLPAGPQRDHATDLRRSACDEKRRGVCMDSWKVG